MTQRNKKIAERFGTKNKARPQSKKNRTMTDNEYYDWGYQHILPKATTLVYHALSQFADNEYQTSFPSCEALMERTGIKNRNQIFKAEAQLEQYRIVEIIHSKGRGANQYKLLSTEVWIKPNHIIIDTVDLHSDELTVSNNNSEPYQNNDINSITDDTGTKLINQTEELKNMPANFNPKETAVFKLLRSYYKEEDVERIINQLYINTGRTPVLTELKKCLTKAVQAGEITAIKPMNF